MKNKVIFVFILANFFFSIELPTFSHGLVAEMTENGAGLHYTPEINKPNIYSKFGLHFERTNVLEVNPFYNSQNPGFQKTMGLLGIGIRQSILKNYFSNNMSVHILAEYSLGNSLSELVIGKLHPDNNRFISGISLQIPSGKITKRYDFCFQTSNKISGEFLIRIHFLKKIL